MEQIMRIKKMEERLERASQVVMKLSAALDDYIDTLEDIRALESYYGSEEWKKNFDDDEAQRLPKDLKRGVLSEDAIWNVLEDNRNLKARMEDCLRQEKSYCQQYREAICEQASEIAYGGDCPMKHLRL